MSSERITLDMTIKQAIIALAEGNPGAVTVMCEILKQAPTIDPDCESFLIILQLDSLGLYGSKIWIVYKDICGENMLDMLTALRAHQLGIISEGVFHESLRRGVFPMAFGTMLKKVQQQLPKFGCSASIDNENQT